MHKILFLLIAFIATSSFAQTGLIKGKIVHEDTKLPYFDVTVTLPKAKVSTTTNASGEYSFSKIPYGTYDMVVSTDGNTEETISVSVNNTTNDVEIIELKSVDINGNNVITDNSGASIENAASDDDNSSSTAGQNVSSVLNSSRDPYLSAATFGWGQYFFRPRGYENDNNMLFLNGVPMNDLEEGGVYYNSWSGLNDVFRGRSVSLGLAPNEVNFGGIGQNTSLDASASNQRKGTKITYTATNRSYRNRIMLTHNSGLMKNGWAYTVSFSKRWAQNGQIAGTFYDAYGYFGAIEKRFKRQGFSLMVVGAPIQRGKSGPSTLLTQELAGTHYYNPYWGYQDGKVRNSRVLKTHQPLFILSHDYKIDANTTLNSALSYQVGETSQTGFDWYNTHNPQPDYYGNLPTYQDVGGLPDSVYNTLAGHPDRLQVDWNGMYDANRMNKTAGYNRSIYILKEDVEASRKLNGNINLQTIASDHITFHAGLSFQSQNNHDFARVNDLLGGDYWLNINQFASRTFGGNALSQNNINDASLVRKVGDIYSYNYNIHYSKAALFTQAVFTYNKFDFFLAGEMGYSGFYRTGNYKNGLYADNSLGDSKKVDFLVGRVKGGATYKLNGRNYIYLNAVTGNRAPYIDNVFVSPRTRNSIITNPMSEKMSSMEAGYLFRSPSLKARLTFFATDVKNASDIKRFYITSSSNSTNVDVSNSFANFVMQGINKRYTGIEFGTEVKITPALSANVAVALTQAFYTSRPYTYWNVDFDTSATADSPTKYDTMYIKNYNIPSGPQSTFQASLNYRSKRFWFATLTFNYLANNWIDFAPSIRSKNGVDLVPYQGTEFYTLIEQKKLNNFYTVDLNAGKSFKVNKYIKKAGNNYYLNLNVGITNLLNNKNIQLYGFENLRSSRYVDDAVRFVPKYAYALGAQYFINVSLKF